MSVALRLPQVTEPPIALPPRNQESDEKKNSRYAIECSCIGVHRVVPFHFRKFIVKSARLDYCCVQYEGIEDSCNLIIQNVALFPAENLTRTGVCCRAIVPIPEDNTGSVSLLLVDTEQQMNLVQKQDIKFEDVPGPLEEYFSVDPEPDLQDDDHYIGVSDVGVGSEVVPHMPENPARVLAKAIVDAAFRSGSRDNLAAIVVPLHDGEPILIIYRFHLGQQQSSVWSEIGYMIPERSPFLYFHVLIQLKWFFIVQFEILELRIDLLVKFEL